MNKVLQGLTHLRWLEITRKEQIEGWSRPPIVHSDTRFVLVSHFKFNFDRILLVLDTHQPFKKDVTGTDRVYYNDINYILDTVHKFDHNTIEFYYVQNDKLRYTCRLL